MDLPNQLETINFTLHMTDAVREKDGQFKDIVFLMIDESLTNEKYKILINHFLSEINKKNRYIF